MNGIKRLSEVSKRGSPHCLRWPRFLDHFALISFTRELPGLLSADWMALSAELSSVPVIGARHGSDRGLDSVVAWRFRPQRGLAIDVRTLSVECAFVRSITSTTSTTYTISCDSGDCSL